MNFGLYNRKTAPEWTLLFEQRKDGSFDADTSELVRAYAKRLCPSPVSTPFRARASDWPREVHCAKLWNAPVERLQAEFEAACSSPVNQEARDLCESNGNRLDHMIRTPLPLGLEPGEKPRPLPHGCFDSSPMIPDGAFDDRRRKHFRTVRAVLVVLVTAVALADALVFVAGRIDAHLNDLETLWIVAGYAEPRRSALAVTIVVGIPVLAFRSRSILGATSLLFAAIAGFFVCLELGMGLYYDVVSGELTARTLMLTRARIDLPSNQDGVCVRANVNGFFTWRLNGIAFTPRLLPLPLASGELREQLTAPTPLGACPDAR